MNIMLAISIYNERLQVLDIRILSLPRIADIKLEFLKLFFVQKNLTH